MSRPFNFTTDSTWPFRVSSSLNLKRERERIQLLHIIVTLHLFLAQRIQQIKSYYKTGNGSCCRIRQGECRSLVKMQENISTWRICRFKQDYWVWCVFYIPGNLSSSLCLFSHLIKFCEITAIAKRLLTLRRLQSMEGPLCMCPFELLFFFPKILFPRESNLQNHWF